MDVTALFSLALVVLAAAVVGLWLYYRRSIRILDDKFHTLLEYAPEAIVILDLDTGKFTEVNQTAERLFKRSRQELCTLGPADVSPEFQADGSPSAESAPQLIMAAAQGDKPSFEWLHVDSNGETIPCEIRLVLLPDSRKLVRGSIVDISDREKAKEREHALEEQLNQSRRLQSLGQFTGGVAHDFNNILTVAMGNLELIEAKQADSDARSLAAQARDSLKKASELVERLLAFSRKQPLQMTRIDTNELLQDLSGMLDRILGENIEISLVMPTNIWACDADRAQLENALINLVINARDAMPQGGTLTLAASNVELSEEDMSRLLEGDNEKNNEFVCFTVQDTGCGIDPSLVNRVFEPFFTTKDVGEGSGLGLSTVYGFARQSGGSIEITSEVGAGTIVRLLLPRNRGDIEPPKAAGSKETRDELLPEMRVLFVEDDPDVCEVGLAFLKSFGCHALAFPSAAPAIAALESGEHFDMLITDVVLPEGIDGVELARQARTLRPDLPVLFCSGYSEEMIGNYESVSELGLLVTKPYSRSRLLEAISLTLNMPERT